MIKNGLILFLLFLGFLKVSAQGLSANCVKSTEGKDFWFGFMENRQGRGCGVVPENYLEVTVTSKYNCQFTISIGNSAVAIVNDVLQPNIPKKFRIDRALAEPSGSENIEKKSLHLLSDQPLNLFAMNYGVNSADASVIFPKEALGKEYFAMCYEPHIVYQTLTYDVVNNLNCGTFLTGKNSEFVIVASEDQTLVTITPSKVTDQLKPANTPYTIMLSKGELYQVQSMNLPNLPGQGDLTGSYIKSDKPIALYSGSWATTVPSTVDYALDHLYEQIPPVRSWGRKFIAVPLKTRGMDTYRILASMDQTTIKIGSKITIVKNRGEFYEFMLNANEPSLIISDHPVLLAQYSNSNDVDRPSFIPQGGAWDGDPAMMIISPVDQTREEVTFIAYDTPEITSKFYVNLVTKDNAINQIQLDGLPIAFKTLPNTGYSYAQVSIAQGNHNLRSTEPGKGFIAYVYGFGGVESYGYGVGFNLNTRIDLGGDIQFVKDTIVLCNGETRVLDAGSQFSNFLWGTGETTQKIDVSKKGYYEVIASTDDGCILTAGITAIVSNPVVKLGNDTIFCRAPSILDAGAGFSSYLWSSNETTRKIPVSASGFYSVKAIDKFGCQARDTIKIIFGQIPKFDLTKLDTVVCGSKTTVVNISADIGSFKLTSTDPTVSIQNLSVTVPLNGRYPFAFRSTDQYACTADTNFTIGFHNTPSVSFDVNESTCYNYALNAKYLGDAQISNTKFTWIFATDTVVSGVAMDRIQLLMGKNQKNRSLYLKAVENGCQNSYKIQEIKVIPDINFSISDTLNCEQKEVVLSASNTENVVDYFWNWGDGTLEHTGKEAIHIYNKSGYYNIQLTATTDKNCTNSIEKKNFLHVAPVPTVDFSIKENQCLDPGTQTLIYLGNGDELAHYDWDLSGFLPDEVIKNPGITMGPLLFDLKSKPKVNIGLQVTSKDGCKSETKSLSVKRKPVFTFGSDLKIGCVPLLIRFMATPGDAVDKIDYHWYFGDGESISGQEVTHTFLHPDQYYNVTLNAISQTTGCSDSLLANNYILAYPSPKAGFSLNPELVFNDDPRVYFLDQSRDALRYLWDFGDGKISELKNPVHKFETVGFQKISQTVFNKYECMDSFSLELMVALRKIYPPNAFSPSSKNLIDRVFKPYSNGVIEQGYNLKIFSRWNDVIFECKNVIKGWDGSLSNGEMAPTGNYIWILEFTDFLGESHRQMGTVMLIY